MNRFEKFQQRFLSLTLTFVFLVLFSGCEKLLFEEKPSESNQAIFEEYVKLITEKYAMLEFKGVDIDQLADSLRATVTSDLTSKELFGKLGVITQKLKDGHTNLLEDRNSADGLTATFDINAGYPTAFDFEKLFNNYLSDTVTFKSIEGGEFGFKVMYGNFKQNPDISYVWIPSWNVDFSDEEFETIFNYIKDSKGLVFDMRLNGGGDPGLASKFASYFLDQSIDTGFERFKTGPGPNDFSDSQIILNPADSDLRYLKPVRVLTDRNVYSASTTFLYSVDPVGDRIKTLGQRSGGGSGSVADGYLANGWYWSLSSSEFIDVLGRHLDDGVDADIPVRLDLSDPAKDELIEAAILDLQ